MSQGPGDPLEAAKKPARSRSIAATSLVGGPGKLVEGDRHGAFEIANVARRTARRERVAVAVVAACGTRKKLRARWQWRLTTERHAQKHSVHAASRD